MIEKIQAESVDDEIFVTHVKESTTSVQKATSRRTDLQARGEAAATTKRKSSIANGTPLSTTPAAAENAAATEEKRMARRRKPVSAVANRTPLSTTPAAAENAAATEEKMMARRRKPVSAAATSAAAAASTVFPTAGTSAPSASSAAKPVAKSKGDSRRSARIIPTSEPSAAPAASIDDAANPAEAIPTSAPAAPAASRTESVGSMKPTFPEKTNGNGEECVNLIVIGQESSRPVETAVVTLPEDDDVEVIEVLSATIPDSPRSLSDVASTESDDDVIYVTPPIHKNDHQEEEMECDDAMEEQSLTASTPSDSASSFGTPSITDPVEGNAMEESVETPMSTPVDAVETTSAVDEMECIETENEPRFNAQTPPDCTPADRSSSSSDSLEENTMDESVGNPSESTPVDDDIVIDELATTTVDEDDGYETAIEIERPVKYIKVKIAGKDGTKIQYRVKKGTPMGKIKRKYSKRMGANPFPRRFLIEERRIKDRDTADGKEIEDGAEIQVLRGGLFGYSSDADDSISCVGSEVAEVEDEQSEVYFKSPVKKPTEALVFSGNAESTPNPMRKRAESFAGGAKTPLETAAPPIHHAGAATQSAPVEIHEETTANPASDPIHDGNNDENMDSEEQQQEPSVPSHSSLTLEDLIPGFSASSHPASYNPLVPIPAVIPASKARGLKRARTDHGERALAIKRMLLEEEERSDSTEKVAPSGDEIPQQSAIDRAVEQELLEPGVYRYSHSRPPGKINIFNDAELRIFLKEDYLPSVATGLKAELDKRTSILRQTVMKQAAVEIEKEVAKQVASIEERMTMKSEIRMTKLMEERMQVEMKNMSDAFEVRMEEKMTEDRARTSALISAAVNNAVASMEKRMEDETTALRVQLSEERAKNEEFRFKSSDRSDKVEKNMLRFSSILKESMADAFERIDRMMEVDDSNLSHSADGV